MDKVSDIDRYNHIRFMCPGCKDIHAIRYDPDSGHSWNWNKDKEKPTFTPSVLVRGKSLTKKGVEDMKTWEESGWPKRNEPFETVETICHSFITDGNIKFLNDCTHELRGKTVELPEWNSSFNPPM